MNLPLALHIHMLALAAVGAITVLVGCAVERRFGNRPAVWASQTVLWGGTLSLMFSARAFA